MSDHETQLYWKGLLGDNLSWELIPTHPVNIACERKPEYPEKTHAGFGYIKGVLLKQ